MKRRKKPSELPMLNGGVQWFFVVFLQIFCILDMAYARENHHSVTSPDAQLPETPIRQMQLFRSETMCAHECEKRCAMGILPSDIPGSTGHQIFYICEHVKIREPKFAAWLGMSGRSFMYVLIGAIVIIIISALLCALLSCIITHRRRKGTSNRDIEPIEPDRVRLSGAKQRPIDV